MKIMITFGVLLTVMTLCGCKVKTTVVNDSNPPMPRRLIFVSDMDHPSLNLKFDRRLLTLSDVHAFVDDYADTQVSTFMVSAGEDIPTYRSKYNRLVGDDDGGRLNCGKNTALYELFRTENRNILNLEKDGIDIVEAQLKRAKEKGMETFLTFRMNDIHFTNPAFGYTLVWSDFWVQHPEYWINENPGWNTFGAYDYAHSEVRQYRLNLIFEQLELYGHLIDGYDLDFQRSPMFFKSGTGAQNSPLMTDFVKTLKSKIDEISAIHGKKIMLSARVPIDIDFGYSEGLDVKEWIKLGLLDFLTISNYVETDPSMPVAKSIQDLGVPQIPIYVAVDYGSNFQPHSVGMKRGIASHIYAQGGNGIYLFNYFFDTPSTERGLVHRKVSRELLMELGSMETLKKRNKMIALNTAAAAFHYWYTGKAPLPLTVSSDVQTVNLFVGGCLQEDVPEQIILFIRTNREVEAGVQINGVNVVPLDMEYVSLYDADNKLNEGEKVYAFSVPVSAVQQGDNEIGIRSQGSEFRVLRLEMAIRYGDVATHGYF